MKYSAIQCKHVKQRTSYI